MHDTVAIAMTTRLNVDICLVVILTWKDWQIRGVSSVQVHLLPLHRRAITAT